MPPVEGERTFFSLKSRMDSTEPSDRQSLTELEPGKYLIICHEDDERGALVTREGDPNTTIRQRRRGELIETTHPYIELFGGRENGIIIDKIDPDTGYTVSFELWHQKGDPDQPPFRRERVSPDSGPPLVEKRAELALPHELVLV